MLIKEKNKKIELIKFAQNCRNSEFNKLYENCVNKFVLLFESTLFLFDTIFETVNFPKIRSAINSSKKTVTNKLVLLTNK